MPYTRRQKENPGFPEKKIVMCVTQPVFWNHLHALRLGEFISYHLLYLQFILYFSSFKAGELWI